MLPYMRPRFKAALATAAAVALPLLGIAFAPAVPALAVTCTPPATTWHTTTDSNSNSIFENADNFGGGTVCFDPGTNGALTTTTSAGPFNGKVLSYPSIGWGSLATYETPGWANELWSTPTMQVTGNITTTNVPSDSTYDMLVDVALTNQSGEFSTDSGEVEIVSYAYPSYAAIGACVSTSCGATQVTLASTTWWRTEHTSPGGWPIWSYVRATMRAGIGPNTGLHQFLANANGVSPGLGSLKLGSVAIGTECWADCNGMQISGVTATSVP